MSETTPIVRKLQADAINQDISVSSLLRTAKVVSTKLDLQDALVWIDRELNGYMDLTFEELPPYRRLKGDLKGYNPYHGWQAIQFENPEHAHLFSQAPIGISIGAIEEDLKGGREGNFTFVISPEKKAHLFKSLDYPTDVQLQLGYGAVYNIVDAVRNLVLNWSLELEKAGILGEDMAFSVDERREAAPISQQFFAQNIGVVGNVSDQAQVSSQQTAAIDVALDIAQVKEFASQVQTAIPLVPDDVREGLKLTVADLDDELAQDAPNQSRLRELLDSVRLVCEGATGNLAAQGILALLGKILGG